MKIETYKRLAELNVERSKLSKEEPVLAVRDRIATLDAAVNKAVSEEILPANRGVVHRVRLTRQNSLTYLLFHVTCTAHNDRGQYVDTVEISVLVTPTFGGVDIDADMLSCPSREEVNFLTEDSVTRWAEGFRVDVDALKAKVKALFTVDA